MFSVTVPGSLDVAPSAPCTHPDIITTKDVEGNLVPDDIGTSVSEDEDHSVLLPHQPDCVFQSKVQGLSCVCGLGQPAQVLHCPGHRDKHTLSSLLTRKRFTRKRQKPDKANVWSAPVIMEVINAICPGSLFKVGDAVNVDSQLHDFLCLCSAVLDNAHPGVVTCKLDRDAFNGDLTFLDGFCTQTPFKLSASHPHRLITSRLEEERH